MDNFIVYEGLVRKHKNLVGENLVKFIDLFCGVGGIRLGMESQNFNCVMSCDINSECRETYFENFSSKKNSV